MNVQVDKRGHDGSINAKRAIGPTTLIAHRSVPEHDPGRRQDDALGTVGKELVLASSGHGKKVRLGAPGEREGVIAGELSSVVGGIGHGVMSGIPEWVLHQTVRAVLPALRIHR